MCLYVSAGKDGYGAILNGSAPLRFLPRKQEIRRAVEAEERKRRWAQEAEAEQLRILREAEAAAGNRARQMERAEAERQRAETEKKRDCNTIGATVVAMFADAKHSALEQWLLAALSEYGGRGARC